MRITTQKRAVVTFGLALSLAAFGSKPSQAASIAVSEAKMSMYNFSYTIPTTSTLLPITFTDANRDTFRLPIDGEVFTDADADANVTVDDFLDLPKVTNVENYSVSQGYGVGNSYYGYAQSSALAKAHNLEISKNTTFSFDFDAALTLFTYIDNAENEKAKADGNIYLEVFDQTNGNVLDSLRIWGRLTAIGNQDFLTYEKSANQSFDVSDTIETDYEETLKVAVAVITGRYSRSFDRDMVLGIRELKSNSVSVQVPEPLSCGGMVIAGVMGWWMKRKRKRSHNSLR
ncbi:PEP-CTERM sorting domain-containing protein [Tolypothrix sp. FACHB-123]|uniref:PEP-CTERM sorting domain-containing protein n=1 Tax=Tolypothrix sp. FACHB-123 TaxID=2692868 RepID=UPI001686DE33|nr:PEP-CTERM sorting domain-containing protein [Tolypothrix sp. FACHB-123]MBD2359484.1 PEP-CTERM sorting domain-containing protein [Tolypothrix sp. FACHB-123]